MNKTLLSAAVFAATLGIAFYFSTTQSVNAGSDKLFRSATPVKDRYIVVLNDDAGKGLVEQETEDLTASYGGRTIRTYSDAIRGYSVEMTEASAEALAKDRRVQYVEEDSFVEPQDVVANPQWALDRIDQRQLPFDLQYHYNSAGAGVNVYVLDSGILTTHDALLGRAFDDYNATADTSPVENCSGHGTGVSGVIASSTWGAARSAFVHSVRVLPCSGAGYLSDVVAGVDWVTRNAVHPAVANMSVRTNYSRTLNSSVTSAIRSGVTVVVAAGNDGDDACNYSPGSTRDAITVGGISSNDNKLGYSNFGSCVSLFAPGEGVATIWNDPTISVTYMSGTSFASPYVAGVAALYLSTHPTAQPSEVKSAIVSNATQNAVVNAGSGSPNLLLYSLVGSVDPPTGCGGTDYLGTLADGQSGYQSSSDGFSSGSGSFAGGLGVPSGAVFSLSLEKKSKSRWSAVANTSGSTSLQISYRGRSGEYRWRVASLSGSGDYSLCSTTP